MVRYLNYKYTMFMSFLFPLPTEGQTKVLKERPSSLHLSLDQVFIILTYNS